MSESLSLTIGQHSNAGRKPINQDRYGLFIPSEPELTTKGITVALADGISTSDVSQEASATSVNSFIADYYATPDSWSVQTSGHRVLQSINSWLYGQTRNSEFRYDMDQGYVCTFSGLVFKANKAYLFHIGDSRIFRLRNNRLTQLSIDHKKAGDQENSYLTRAMGLEQQFHCDSKTFDANLGDIFILATDGVYDFIDENQIIAAIKTHTDDLQKASESLIQQAFDAGSDDNLTIQIVRVETLPPLGIPAVQHASLLPAPPALAPKMEFDGFEILRELYVSSRSHVFLAKDMTTQENVVLKVLSTDLEDDQEAIERFLMEEWVTRRLNSVHCLKAIESQRQRHFLYSVTEFIEGQTLTQWMQDNPQPSLDQVRRIVEQIAKGLQTMHRREMIHQDIRPDNIMIDSSGTVKIIDFGSTRVAGVAELGAETDLILGTAQFTAPEYFLGYEGTPQSDIFSLAVLTYHLLSHELPYGSSVSKAYSVAAQRKLSYRSLVREEHKIPFWVDDTIRKAASIQPHKRYQEVAEFVYDLGHPNKVFLNKAKPPLIDRDPVLFWKCVSTGLLLIVLYQTLADYL
ncbi:bifunctional protein-serine/threonine kinase/phosphatase [Methylophaga thiooxydans]|uniref:bifunctional protein-serine/threonine kinase/phosphatase n=1 Tax=Methylophaga thiooxydans TaxID=392484 RepID=UPI002356982D|nr:bifunctional protein-serine/threonine kinase/phosphatase [Methylophaga thiooxydans]